MNLNKFLLISILFLSISISLYQFLSISSKNGQISGISTKSSSVNMDISIGEYQFSLYGYSSPSSLVTIQGMGIFDQTYTNQKGYFEFNNRFSPFNPREACLTARDQFGRTTNPTCIPPFPTKYDVTIGPVLIPPTLSSDKENYWVGDEVKLSGQTTPNSEVNFSLFTAQSVSTSFYKFLPVSIIPQVEAFTFPDLITRADEKGNFSLSLPSSRPEFFRFFAQTSYENNKSPESIKLNLKILPVWMIIIQLLLLLWSIIKSRLLEIIIIGELIGLALFFLRRYLHPHVIAANRALAIREVYPIVEEETAALKKIEIN